LLISLDIRDFALIEHLQISWSAGLNVLTGETGAGKSIIIDAVNAVLGGKVAAGAIRNQAEKAIIEACFKQNAEVSAWLKLQELQNEEGDELFLSREINKNGSRVRINGTLVNLQLVQELRHKLLTIHAQHEARSLLAPQAQLDLLDGLGDQDHQKTLDKVKTLWVQKRELSQQLNDLQISEEERLRRLDFASFQLQELTDAALGDADEYDALSKECTVLGNVAQLEASAFKAQECISGESDSCVVDLLQQALVEVDKAAELDGNLLSISAPLHDCLHAVEEASRALRRYREGLDTDPESLSTLESRLNLLAGIKRKYGPELKDALLHQETLAAEVSKLQGADLEVSQLKGELTALEKQLQELAASLSSRRQKLAAKLANAIKSELADLGMERCQFEIAFETTDGGPSGIDKVEFLISANPGQPLLPVAKIASGGELSRVMLAIKSIFAEADRTATVVFDEIDTGLSGKVLQSMRDKLARLAKSHQILCITHQPIIASVADNHILISKDHAATTTHIAVNSLDKQQRLKSLAGMASGQDDQVAALRFAESLYDEAAKLRASLT
jgi:DNA repair protein RecN (Recombination protein N)